MGLALALAEGKMAGDWARGRGRRAELELPVPSAQMESCNGKRKLQ